MAEFLAKPFKKSCIAQLYHVIMVLKKAEKYQQEHGEDPASSGDGDGGSDFSTDDEFHNINYSFDQDNPESGDHGT